MNLAQLDTRFIPPFLVPVRFFITAPLFALLAGLLLIWQGEMISLSRWAPATLAFVHLLTLGVLLMNMTGAVMQVLPVLHGQAFPGIRWLPHTLHLLLSAGCLLLTGAFIWGDGGLFFWAGILLSLHIALFTFNLLKSIGNPFKAGSSAQAMVLAAALLLLTLFSGLGLLGGYLPDGQALDKSFTQLHLTLALKGWSLLLIFAVAQQVIPMFHVTPDFPRWLVRFWPWSYSACLLAYTLSLYASSPVLVVVFQGLELLLSSALAVLILRLIQQRKRKIPDSTRACWQLGWGFLLLGNGLLAVSPFWPEGAENLLHWWLGCCWLVGFILTVISGMLLKIMPFLSYLHLQQQAGMHMQAMMLVPNMHQLLEQKHSLWFFRVWLVLLGSFLLAPLALTLTWLAGLCLMVSAMFLLGLLLNCVYRYRRYQQNIQQAIEQEGYEAGAL